MVFKHFENGVQIGNYCTFEFWPEADAEEEENLKHPRSIFCHGQKGVNWTMSENINKRSDFAEKNVQKPR